LVRQHAAAPPSNSSQESFDSYRRLADVFHGLLAEQSLESLLDRMATTLAEIVSYEALTLYTWDETRRELLPLLARGNWAREAMDNPVPAGHGLTGWAIEHLEPVLANQAHLDPRVGHVPGTPTDPDSLIVVPLIARGIVKGTLNIYRLGEEARFAEDEFDLARRFADAAALAIDNAQTRARLEHQAQTDSLTGLYNHRHFHERLKGELARAGRTADSVALVMLDFDDFKRVNDVHGHAAGDLALIEFAELLRGLVRQADVICRVGGEEFGVIMPSSTTTDAVALAGRIRAGLEQVELSPDGPLCASIGVAEGPKHALNARELAACAEASMMSAKAAGGNRIVIFSEADGSRPDAPAEGRDARSIAHLKMLQSLSGKLNRLNDVRAIGVAIVTELRSLIDYSNCRVVVVDGDRLAPIAFRGDLGSPHVGEDALGTRVGEGITGRAAATGESILVPNVRDCDFAIPVPGTPDEDETIAAVPLRYGPRVIGVIVVAKLGAAQLDGDDVRLLEVLAGHASVALENARLYEEQRRAAVDAAESAEVAEALLAFGGRLATSGGLEETARSLLEAARELFDARRASFWLQDSETTLELVAEIGDAPLQLPERFSTEAVMGYLAAPRPYVLDRSHLDELGIEPPPGTRYAVAPIKVEQRRGVIALAVETGSRNEARMLRLLAGVADQAALAMTRACNWDALESMFVSTVEVLANALDATDQTRTTHARWITAAALQLGEALGVTGDDVRRLEHAALFHDIGKIGVPHDVLLKPGPLTDEERAAVERNPEIGERILSPVDRLGEVARIVRACHERWDGGGYPDGLRGEEIPLAARIIFVCDAYHAMVTDRPYRAAMPADEARRRLKEAAGTQFDPRAVEAFLCLDVPGSLD
jgi:diguanylate cyclase (GGDEF)-like protein